MYKAICKNNFFPQTELYTRINKKGIKKELLEKDILKIKEYIGILFVQIVKI